MFGWLWSLLKKAFFLIIGGAIIAGVYLMIPVWKRRPSYPPTRPPLDEKQAIEHLAQLAAQSEVRAEDVAVPFAPGKVTNFQVESEGRNFYKGQYLDIEGAEKFVHINQYGFNPGEVAKYFAPLLIKKAREGVEVRLIIDSWGSLRGAPSHEMYDQMARAGVQIVANRGVIPGKDGLYPNDPNGVFRLDQPIHQDHRKVFIIDGRAAWVGGAGIEDHFAFGQFHDVFCRVEGSLVNYINAMFLDSWRFYNGPLTSDPAELAKYFPPHNDTGGAPGQLLMNVSQVGFLQATDAIEQLVQGVQHRLEIMNPFIGDGTVIEGIKDAARRGVQVRMLVPGDPPDSVQIAPLQHHMQELQSLGVKIYQYPAMVHAKIVVADDKTLIGTVNLDAFALYRNWETALLIESAEYADLTRHNIFDTDIPLSKPADPPTSTLLKARNWVMWQFRWFM